ncbi:MULTISPECIES: GNAT family N-acetyltransferase [Lactobacillaceae]|uniref:GNAT family N-acetyltransferase n=1 Tax=Lactobacillaceae TaxID=33958 RepID=UPI0014570D66|nr:GNAT family protein [Lactobacillus sp. HBUAS51381]NLR08409.1 GNAT family N-acetyltransferase [Lactobacillus sp. HBUAS51381]
MTTYSVSPYIQLKSPQLSDAPALFACIAADRPYLSQWLPWAATTRTVADETAFLKYCQQRIASHQLWLTVIWVAGRPAGMIDLHDFKDHHAAVGYWLNHTLRGQGITTKCLATVETIGFNTLKLHSLNLLAEPENHASRAVAEHRGFHQDGLLRAHIPTVQGDYRDAVIYSKINREFTP